MPLHKFPQITVYGCEKGIALNSAAGTVKLYSKHAGAGHKLELLDELQANHVGCEWGEYC